MNWADKIQDELGEFDRYINQCGLPEAVILDGVLSCNGLDTAFFRHASARVDSDIKFIGSGCVTYCLGVGPIAGVQVMLLWAYTVLKRMGFTEESKAVLDYVMAITQSRESANRILERNNININ